MTLMFIAVLTIVGSTAITINSTDLLLGGAFHCSQIAFHNADSGVNFTTSQVSTLIADDRLKLDGTKLFEPYKFRNPIGFVFNRDRKNKIETLVD